MAKQQQIQSKREAESAAAKKGGKGKPPEKKASGIGLPNVESKELLEELSKMRAVTPYGVASRFNVKLSVAKDILEELERRRVVQQVGGNSRIRIYSVVPA